MTPDPDEVELVEAPKRRRRGGNVDSSLDAYPAGALTLEGWRRQQATRDVHFVRVEPTQRWTP